MPTTTTAPKLRHSRQRNQIYTYLCQSSGHPSAEMIYDSLRSEIPSLSLGTVYRNLALLEKLGQIRRVSALGSSERYDARLESHSHFVCTACGTIQDLDPIDEYRVRKLGGLGANIQIQRTDITFHGCCATCMEDAG